MSPDDLMQNNSSFWYIVLTIAGLLIAGIIIAYTIFHIYSKFQQKQPAQFKTIILLCLSAGVIFGSVYLIGFTTQMQEEQNKPSNAHIVSTWLQKEYGVQISQEKAKFVSSMIANNTESSTAKIPVDTKNGVVLVQFYTYENEYLPFTLDGYELPKK